MKKSPSSSSTLGSHNTPYMTCHCQESCSIWQSNRTNSKGRKFLGCSRYKVWEVPEGAEVMAFSEKTGVEMFTYGDRIMGIQGHPEYTKDILNNLIDHLVSNNSIDGAFANHARKMLEEAEPERKFWEKVSKRFLEEKKTIQSL